MIKLNLEEYCQNCPEFEVKQINPDTLYDGIDKCILGDITLTCEYIRACRNAVRFYKKKLKE